ncbi:HYR domain-containing protein [Rasiella sp. SM2506]|uniref:HYR domain-containing protein n=1 Tax=Rasiella sp. SM2506 TaxID=3423914 RepID=UPI003D7B37E6
MKAKRNPLGSTLVILLLICTMALQAQSPKRVIQQNLVSQNDTANTFNFNTTGTRFLQQRVLPSDANAMVAAPISTSITALGIDTWSKMSGTQPKVVVPTASQLAEADKKVAIKIAALKAQSNTSFVLDTHDNVSLRYDASSNNIILSSLESKSLILKKVSKSSLENVLIIQGNDKDNNLVVDNTILDLGIDIVYDGGGEHTTTGDILTVINRGSAWKDVVSTAFNKSSGRIVVDNKSSIMYTGLEPIILLDAGGATLTLNLPDGPNPDVVIENAPTPNFTLISGSTFENVSFNGYDAVVINGGTSTDNVSFQGLDPLDTIPVTLNFDTDDIVTFETTETNLGSEDLTVHTGFLIVSAAITTSGSINLTSERNTLITNAAVVQSTDGNITSLAGTNPVPGDDFIGVHIEANAEVKTTGIGNIAITGTGVYATNNLRMGVAVLGGGKVLADGAGSISITGTGGNGTERNYGVGVEELNSTVESNGGGITITGTGGTGTADFNSGIYVRFNSLVQDLNGGDIILFGEGNGAATSRNSRGIVVSDADVLTNTGAINITGNGAFNTASYGDGILFLLDSNIQSVEGNITIIGTGNSVVEDGSIGVSLQGKVETTGTGTIQIEGIAGDGENIAYGVATNNFGTIKSNNGAINIIGQGGNLGNVVGGFSLGVLLTEGIIESVGSGNITIQGTGGDGTNFSGTSGVYLQQTTRITANEGSIAITGQAGTSTGMFNSGIVSLESSIETMGTGTMTLNGMGGSGSESTNGIVLQTGMLLSNDGDIIINATGGVSTENFAEGMAIAGGTIRSSGGGAITINGTGGTSSLNNAAGIQMLPSDTSTTLIETNGGGITLIGTAGTSNGLSSNGVLIAYNTLIQDIGAGSISITGQGGTGTTLNNGVVLMNSSRIASTSGDIEVIGSTNGTNNLNNGVFIELATIESISGSITLNGTGSIASNGDDNRGVVVSTARLQTAASGIISITGVAGNGSSNNSGIDLIESIVSAADGNILMDGTGGANTSGNQNSGIQIATNSFITTSGSGDIDLTGMGRNGAGVFHIGIALGNAARIEALGAGAVTLEGTGGDAFSGNYGVFMDTANPMVTTNGGGISITGTAGNGGGNLNVGIRLGGATITDLSSTGSISLNGTSGSGSGSGNEIGVALFGNTIVSNGGGVSITGAGGSGSGNYTAGVVLENSTINDTAMGDINFTGTGGNAGGSIAAGLYFTISSVTTLDGSIFLNGTGGTALSEQAMGIALFSSPLTTSNGDIQITGESTDTTGDFNDGIDFIESIIEATNGNVALDGTSSSATYAGIIIFSANVPIIAGGTITATTAVGPLNTPEGILATAIFEAPTTFINGVFSPGDYTEFSIGQATITGDFDLTSGLLEVKIDDITTPGTDYDQVVVNGVVDVAGATLTLVNNFVGTLTQTDEFVIIDNDGTDAIVGTFDGLPNNAAIPFNGQFVFIHYDGGDGNDVVLVVDSTPTAICQDFTAQLDATGNVTILPSDVDGGSFDPDGLVTLSLNIDSFTCADVGTPVIVTLTVTDSTGNTTTCTATVTVEDTIAPLINCPADITVGTDMPLCGAIVHFAGPIPVDNCGIASVVQTAGLPSGSVFPVGVSVVAYTATDVNGNTTPCSFTITVVDDDAPLTICMDITIQLNAAGTATIVPADVDGGSTDNCAVDTLSIDIDTFTCANVGPNNVILTVTDLAGNMASCTVIVTVEDVTPPVAVCQDITVVLDATGIIVIDSSLLDGGSTDACGTANFTYTATPDTFTCAEVGDNTVTLTITDENGNSATCEATVTVIDDTAPALVCQDITVQLDENGMVSILPGDVIASLDDACGIDTTGLDIDDFSCDDIGTPVVVNVFASDVNGNIVTCTATVTVVDELAPVLTCPADQTVEINNGTQYTVPDYFATGEAIAIDNCTDPVVITSQDPAVGAMLDPGTYTVTITAEDAFENEASCTFELTVDELLGVSNTGFDMASLTMYPNPATNFVLLNNPQNIPLKDVSIYDVTGRLIKIVDASQVTSEMTIDISELASATYMVLIHTDASPVTKQLVKE